MTRRGPATVTLPADVREVWRDMQDAVSDGLLPAKSADVLRHARDIILGKKEQDDSKPEQ